MEFAFDVNNLFTDEISVVDRSLKPSRANSLNLRQRRAELCKVIDDVGQASARAQSLHGPITTAGRLSQSDHHLYIIIEPQANDGHGIVVGLLKVGSKKLFVYDHQGIQHEMQPLCVLDFYVHESCQRRGYGRKLFEFMLQREGVNVRHLAIDRPSPKFLSFLQKHYNLKATIQQVNNFVIFDGFFRDRPSTTCQGRWQQNYTNGSMSPVNRQNTFELQQHLTEYQRKDEVYSSATSSGHSWSSSPDALYRASSAVRNSPTVGGRPMLYSRHAGPSLVDRTAAGSSMRGGSDSPSLLHRDRPSSRLSAAEHHHHQQQQQCAVGNDKQNTPSHTYMDRHGGHLRLTQAPTQNWPDTRVVGGTSSQVNSSWKIFGIAPRSWPNSTTATNISAPSSASRKYQRTSLW